MITTIYTSHLVFSGLIILVMIWLYSKSNKDLETGIRSSLILVYSLVMVAASLFALRYYSSPELPGETLYSLSQVMSYFLFFGALWHILMAMVSTGMKSINSNSVNSAREEYDPNGKSIINI